MPAGWSASDIKKRVHVASCHSPDLTHLVCDRLEPPCYNAPPVRASLSGEATSAWPEQRGGKPVWPVVWAFYYPQVS